MSLNSKTTVDRLTKGVSLSRDLGRSDAFASEDSKSKLIVRSSSNTAQAVSGRRRDRVAPRAVLSSGAVTAPGAINYTFKVVYIDRSGLNRRSIRSGNVVVTGPNGFRQIATLARKTVFNRPGTRATATYRINTPGGTWDFADNGGYTVSMLRRKVSDVNRNFVKTGAIGRGFQVNIANPIPSNPRPTAAFSTGVVGGNNYTFNLTYSDDVAINASTLDGNDIQVTGPGGFSQAAQLVSVNTPGNGTPRVATYRVNSPGTFWTAANNGAYTISLVADQVSDSAGATVVAANLGSFTIDSTRIPPSATLTATNISSTGATTYDFQITYADNESVNASSIGNGDVRVTGPNGFNQVATFVSVDANSNGTPRIATYRLTAPGGRWDGPDAGTYVVSAELNQVSDVGGNTIPEGSVGTFAVTIESVAPTATLVSGPQFNLNSGAAYFAVKYEDAAGLNAPSFNSRNIRVTGPNGYDQFADFIRSDVAGVTYRINAPGGNWDGIAAEDGTYTATLQAGQIVDVNGNSAQSVVGNFQVRLAPFRVEAESLNLSSYVVEQLAAPLLGIASGDRLIRLPAGITEGTATTAFNGPAGTYNLNIGYFDENDGISRVELRVNNTLVAGGDWNFDDDTGTDSVSLQSLVRRQISNVQLTPGATIELRGFRTAPGTSSTLETARVDYIDFIPVNNTAGPNNGLPGVILGVAGDNAITASGSTNTVDYSQLANGIIANLTNNRVFKPIYGALDTAKIMPMGDSITLGTHDDTPQYPGAYRVQLNNRFTQDGLDIDYVGAVSQAGTPLADNQVEAYSGNTFGSLNGLFAITEGVTFGASDPDVILLMAGSADTRAFSLSELKTNLERLINAITAKLPDAQLLVSSVPLTNTLSGPQPTQDDLNRTQRTSDYNTLISGIVGNAVVQGRNVSFVDASSTLNVGDLASAGVNVRESGHVKIANAWYDALVDKDTLSGIQNIVGSALIDNIVGNANANIIEGGLGTDTLAGGGGADTFVYRSAAEGGDTITDFTATDFIQISASGFGNGLVTGTALTTGTASATGTFVNGNTAVGTGPNFLYSGGVLRFDADGVGAQAAVTIATLTGSPALTASRINIVA